MKQLVIVALIAVIAVTTAPADAAVRPTYPCGLDSPFSSPCPDPPPTTTEPPPPTTTQAPDADCDARTIGWVGISNYRVRSFPVPERFTYTATGGEVVGAKAELFDTNPAIIDEDTGQVLVGPTIGARTWRRNYTEDNGRLDGRDFVIRARHVDFVDDGPTLFYLKLTVTFAQDHPECPNHPKILAMPVMLTP